MSLSSYADMRTTATLGLKDGRFIDFRGRLVYVETLILMLKKGRNRPFDGDISI